MHSYLSEFHEEAFRKGIHEEGVEEGFLDAVSIFIQKLKVKDFSASEAINQVIEYFNLSEQEASDLVNEYWT